MVVNRFFFFLRALGNRTIAVILNTEIILRSAVLVICDIFQCIVNGIIGCF